MSVFKLCGRPLRGYLLTPQTSALGMRDGAGNVPEPPAPRTVGIAGTRGQAVAAWHRARGPLQEGRTCRPPKAPEQPPGFSFPRSLPARHKAGTGGSKERDTPSSP